MVDDATTATDPIAELRARLAAITPSAALAIATRDVDDAPAIEENEPEPYVPNEMTEEEVFEHVMADPSAWLGWRHLNGRGY